MCQDTCKIQTDHETAKILDIIGGMRNLVDIDKDFKLKSRSNAEFNCMSPHKTSCLAH